MVIIKLSARCNNMLGTNSRAIRYHPRLHFNNKRNPHFILQGSRFIALADYCAVGHSEVSMKEGETVELLKIGCAGWWFVRVLGNNIFKYIISIKLNFMGFMPFFKY